MTEITPKTVSLLARSQNGSPTTILPQSWDVALTEWVNCVAL